MLRLLTHPLSVGPLPVFMVLGVVVAIVTGGALPRARRLSAMITAMLVAGLLAAMTGEFMVEMAVGAISNIALLSYGLTRRGLLRLALAGAALGALLNIGVIVANGAMPFDDGGGKYTVATDLRDRYEPITDSTKFSWLADVIPVPGTAARASLGDVLLWINIALGIVAIAHSPDGTGGTGRLRRRRWYHAQYEAAIEVEDWEAARRALDAGLDARPDDGRLRWHALNLAMFVGDYRAAADGALEVLADRDLTDNARGWFLDTYSDALLMEADPTTLDAAEKALGEAETLLPGQVRLQTSRALLGLRRGDLSGAAAFARVVLDRDTPNEHPRARMVLLDTLLTKYQLDGQAAPELLDLLEGLVADEAIHPGAEYLSALAVYYSHTGDHARAAALLRRAAASGTDASEGAAIGYHLAYVLARAGDASIVAEIDQLLADLPPGYPSAPALAHTTALRHLSATNGPAALASASTALNSAVLTPADAAEVRLTIADALDAMARHSDAAGFRSAATQWAPQHQLLEHVHA